MYKNSKTNGFGLYTDSIISRGRIWPAVLFLLFSQWSLFHAYIEILTSSGSCPAPASCMHAQKCLHPLLWLGFYPAGSLSLTPDEPLVWIQQLMTGAYVEEYKRHKRGIFTGQYCVWRQIQVRARDWVMYNQITNPENVVWLIPPSPAPRSIKLSLLSPFVWGWESSACLLQAWTDKCRETPNLVLSNPLECICEGGLCVSASLPFWSTYLNICLMGSHKNYIHFVHCHQRMKPRPMCWSWKLIPRCRRVAAHNHNVMTVILINLPCTVTSKYILAC